jgi:hypothetical protein
MELAPAASGVAVKLTPDIKVVTLFDIVIFTEFDLP